MSASDNALSTVELFNEAFNRHDVDAVMALMTDDVVFENTSGGRFEGHEAIRGLLVRAFELMSLGWFATEDAIAAGDHCVVLWTYMFDREEPERGLARGIDLFRVRDGLFAEKLSYEVRRLCATAWAQDPTHVSLRLAGPGRRPARLAALGRDPDPGPEPSRDP